jgi:hypothetical protein
MSITLGILASSRTSVPLLLDDYPDSSSAYSLRKLRSNYSGFCIRVRRSSDNAEQDIGFVNNIVDITALTTFCGAGDGFLSFWYDQSVFGNNLRQTILLAQPQIVNSGNILLLNSEPTLLFNGTSQYFISSLSLSSIQTTIVAVSKQTSVDANYRRLLSFDLFSDGYYLGSNAGTDDMLAIFDNIILTCFGGTSITQNITIAYNNSTTGFLISNGTQVNSITTTVVSYGSKPLYVGTDRNLGASEFWNGNIQEIIIYPTNQSSNLSGINTNINSFYLIY